MPAIKAKQVRLIDILNLFSDNTIVVVTINGGRNSYSNYPRVLENDLKSYLSSNVKGVTINSGTVQIFI